MRGSRGSVFRLSAAPLLLLALAAGSWSACRAGEAAAGEGGSGAVEAPAEAAPVPVLVELFTSQGCSSCPPADRLVASLGREAASGVEVVPLSLHVDYWNRLGWRDPFSSAEWSRRQGRYAEVLEAGRLYTPQAVVDGRAHCVGSDRRELAELVAAAARRPRGGAVAARLSNHGEDRLRIEVRAELLEASAGLELLVALVESGLETEVASGENARRTLANDHVVRRLESVGRLAGQPGDELERRLDWSPRPGWRPERLGVVAFLQDPRSLAVEGVARVRPAGSGG